MLKPLTIHKKEDIPEDWQQHYMLLFMEDDAPVPDKETTTEAFVRIAGFDPRKENHHLVRNDDHGDGGTEFYKGGWVRSYYPGGGEVGVLVQHVPPHNWGLEYQYDLIEQGQYIMLECPMDRRNTVMQMMHDLGWHCTFSGPKGLGPGRANTKICHMDFRKGTGT